MKSLALSLLACCHLSSPYSAPGSQDVQDGQADIALVVDARKTVVPARADSGYRDDDGSGDACSTACHNLWRLGCPESQRNAANDTCSTTCRKSILLLNVPCVSLAKTQTEVRLCQVRCER